VANPPLHHLMTRWDPLGVFGCMPAFRQLLPRTQDKDGPGRLRKTLRSPASEGSWQKSTLHEHRAQTAEVFTLGFSTREQSPAEGIRRPKVIGAFVGEVERGFKSWPSSGEIAVRVNGNSDESYTPSHDRRKAIVMHGRAGRAGWKYSSSE